MARQSITKLENVTFIFCLLHVISIGDAIKCYQCDNQKMSSCGTEFKAYQFEAQECPPNTTMCGKQTDDPSAGGWVGVMRGCYNFGTLPGINDSIGCREFYHPVSKFNALYCFCDRDFCNAASTIKGGPWSSPSSQYLFVIALLVALLQPLTVLGSNFFSGVELPLQCRIASLVWKLQSRAVLIKLRIKEEHTAARRITYRRRTVVRYCALPNKCLALRTLSQTGCCRESKANLGNAVSGGQAAATLAELRGERGILLRAKLDATSAEKKNNVSSVRL